MLEFVNQSGQADIIEMRGVFQEYDEGRVKVLDNLDFLVEDKPDQGQFVCILGPSGSGKSTLLRYMANLQSPTAGTVKILGEDPNPQQRVSMVFQQYSSLPWMTVLDNVSLALRYQGVSRKERDQRALELIKEVGLQGHELKYAQYPTLSGGQLQRVAIARSMLANPSILLMDEPFGALDIKTRLQMQDLLAGLWHKFQSTIIFVTHDIAEAVYLADDIYILSGPPAKFVHHVDVTLPLHRDRSVKRSKEYTEIVHHVEDLMVSVSNHM